MPGGEGADLVAILFHTITTYHLITYCGMVYYLRLKVLGCLVTLEAGGTLNGLSPG